MEQLVKPGASKADITRGLWRLSNRIAEIEQQYLRAGQRLAEIIESETLSDDVGAISTVKLQLATKLSDTERLIKPTMLTADPGIMLRSLKQNYMDVRYRTIRVILHLAECVSTIDSREDDEQAVTTFLLLWAKKSPTQAELKKDIISEMNILWMKVNRFAEEKAHPALLEIAAAIATPIKGDDEIILDKVYKILGLTD